MDLDLNEITSFLEDYKNNNMPKSLRNLILRGNKIKYKELETYVIEFKSLKRNFFPEIIEKIKDPGYNKPFTLLRLSGKPNYFVYNPENGDYLGEFDITSID